jgi:hypothetical protein
MVVAPFGYVGLAHKCGLPNGQTALKPEHS